ncbi:hypothetical protein ACCO45_010665 [Purpureocillium lilacinum]|uniref:Uncharacterized protein n=1 Tax=Purpureocillium lilacinum TaxID=33203 RepID=A0ACC4DFF1_PURLI
MQDAVTHSRAGARELSIRLRRPHTPVSERLTTASAGTWAPMSKILRPLDSWKPQGQHLKPRTGLDQSDGWPCCHPGAASSNCRLVPRKYSGATGSHDQPIGEKRRARAQLLLRAARSPTTCWRPDRETVHPPVACPSSASDTVSCAVTRPLRPSARKRAVLAYSPAQTSPFPWCHSRHSSAPPAISAWFVAPLPCPDL